MTYSKLCSLLKQKRLETPVSKHRAFLLLQECTEFQDLELGRNVQSLVIHSGLESVALLANHLIRLFGSCGSLFEANQAFNRVSSPDQYTWNAIIDAHSKLHQEEVGFQLCYVMQHDGKMADKFTFLSTLKACCAIGSIQYGMFIHGYILTEGLHSDLVVASALLHMYGKCEHLSEASKFFHKLQKKDVVCWGAMVAAYAQHGECYFSLQCFQDMQQAGIKPDKVIFLSILKAIGTIEEVRWIHEQILRSRLQADIVVGSTLIDTYTKCGSLDEAYGVFQRLQNRDRVLWGVMIAGYIHHGECNLALDCFQNMQQQNIKPDKVIYLSMSKACGAIGAIIQSRYIYEQVIVAGLLSDVIVTNTLVDMYLKCGNIEEAWQVFTRLQSHGTVSWNVLITGYAQLGEVRLAMQCFEGMQHAGMKPDGVAFLAILVVLARVGMLEEGFWYFTVMQEACGITANASHIASMVDLLARTGCLKEAATFFRMTMQLNTYLWLTLLNACRMHCNMELGIQCFEIITHSDPLCAAAYSLMSCIYANSHRHELSGQA